MPFLSYKFFSIYPIKILSKKIQLNTKTQESEIFYRILWSAPYRSVLNSKDSSWVSKSAVPDTLVEEWEKQKGISDDLLNSDSEDLELNSEDLDLTPKHLELASQDLKFNSQDLKFNSQNLKFNSQNLQLEYLDKTLDENLEKSLETTTYKTPDNTISTLGRFPSSSSKISQNFYKLKTTSSLKNRNISTFPQKNLFPTSPFHNKNDPIVIDDEGIECVISPKSSKNIDKKIEKNKTIELVYNSDEN